jgi:hypothetical protein
MSASKRDQARSILDSLDIRQPTQYSRKVVEPATERPQESPRRSTYQRMTRSNAKKINVIRSICSKS